MKKGLSVVDVGIHTLRGVHFGISPGHCAGLCGPSGSGKTLLLRALSDLDPHTGTVWLDGVASTDIPAPQWRRRVGLLPAETAWWHDTVEPHFGRVPEKWLADLGFDASVMTWQIRRLSTGERQRLGVLRLLANRPDVLLLDEPTANLDPLNIDRVDLLLGDYRRRNRPMILWVSHDTDQLKRNCSAIHTIRGDRLVTEPCSYDDKQAVP